MTAVHAGSSNLLVATWNLEWAPPRSVRGALIRERLEECRADVICITEGHSDNLPPDGDTIESHPDYGYPLIPHRRKVIVWTRHKWRAKDTIGSPLLPSGRFAAGILELPQGTIRIAGVCIPWSAAHVSTGRRDRAPWQDHLSYLEGLGAYVKKASEAPTILLGDFNQAIPRFRQPVHVEQGLRANVLDHELEPISRNLLCEDGLPLIDHICVSKELSGEVIAQFPKRASGIRLSDHTGILARIVQ